MIRIDNVRDGRDDGSMFFGSWDAEPLDYGALVPGDVGRTVIYRDSIGRASAGTITSWRGGFVFARYGTGDTAAGATPGDLLMARDAMERTNA